MPEVSLITTPSTAEAAETPNTVPLVLRTRQDFEDYIDQEAPKYGLSPAKPKAVINCETGGTWNPSIQSGYYANGVREDSWGLAQINRPLTKGITYVQAKNPKFAIDYLLSHWYTDTWSCQHGTK